MRKLVLLVLASALAVHAQRVVRAAGDATVSVPPDEARLMIAVTTQGSTAEEAASRNSAQTTNVIARMKEALGQTGDLDTVGYSINPDYKYNQGGGQPTVVGYTCTNSLVARTSDLNLPGRLIDVAISAGATTVGGLSFTLKQDDRARAQVLGLAAKKAKANAEAIAAGLGGRIGIVISAGEGGTTRIVPATPRDLAAVTPQTPIETGLVQVFASVTVEAELLP